MRRFCCWTVNIKVAVKVIISLFLVVSEYTLCDVYYVISVPANETIQANTSFRINN